MVVKASALLCLLTILTITNVQGSSQRSKPIKDIYHVTDVRIDLVDDSSSFNTYNKKKKEPIQLCSQDSFYLHLSISDHQRDLDSSSSSSSIIKEKVEKKEESFTLLLKPKHSHFFHPNAKITNYYHDVKKTNNNTHTEKKRPLLSNQVLIYTGSVYYNQNITTTGTTRGDLQQNGIYLSDQSYNHQNDNNDHDNWASIVVHNDFGSSCVSIDENLVFEGAFMFHNHLWHLKSLQSFKNVRGLNDPLPIVNNTTASKKPEPNVVAWCDSFDNNKDMSINSSRSIIRNDSTESLRVERLEYSKQKKTQKGSTRKNLEKRQTMASDIAGSMSTNNIDYSKTIGSKEGCPNTLKVVYIGIAVDCTYINKFGGSIDSIRLSILNDMNLVSSLYQRTFNISLGILEIFFPPNNVDPNNQQQLVNTCPSNYNQDLSWNSECPSSNTNGQGLLLEQRLDQFSLWRSKKGPSDGAGLWHLMTDCPNGSEVGISWLGALCKVNAENGVNGGTTSGTGVTSCSPNQWQTMAHEIGHSFGAVHDCTEGCNEGDGCCPATSTSCFTEGGGGGPYIMAPSSTNNEATNLGFSACSIGNICNNIKLGSGNGGVETSCIMEPGNKYTITINQCGNGIIEPGEDCDPGTTFSPCCQWGICKFSNGAVCDPNPKLAPCCNSNCQFATANSPCNSSDFTSTVVGSTSSVPGTCPGNSPKCSPSSASFN